MSANQEPKQGREEGSGLTSPEYRTRLLHKLNCLIAVLEVAITKIGRTLEGPPERVDRMLKIRSNLENTLAICRRARATLDRKSIEGPAPSGVVAIPANPRPSPQERMSYRDYVELMSVEEYRKFKKLPPIDAREIRSTDLEGLISKLQG